MSMMWSVYTNDKADNCGLFGGQVLRNVLLGGLQVLLGKVQTIQGEQSVLGQSDVIYWLTI